MTFGRFRRWSGVAAVCLVALAGCTDDPEPAAGQVDQALCDREVRGLVDELQAYVDAFDGVGPLDYALATDLPDPAGVERALARYEQRIDGFDCDAGVAHQLLTRELERLRGDGVIADAIAGGLRQTTVGASVGPAQDIEVGVDDDLAGIAVTAPSGSTLRLSAGDHRTAEPVVIPHAVTIVGAGQDRTRLVSTAEESAVLVLGTGELELADLTVTHDASRTSAVVVLAATTYQLRNVTVEGGKVEEDGTGGIGLYVESGVEGPAAPVDRGDAPQRLLDGVTIRDNEGPGLYVAGTSAPWIAGGAFLDNGTCGVCYVQDAGGRLEDSRVSGNDVGILVSGRADPEVVGSTIADNRTDGVVVDAAARGRIHDSLITTSGDRGVTVSGEATPTFEGNRIVDNGQLGIVVLGSAMPVLERNEVSGSAIGIWVEGDGGARLLDNDIVGPSADGSDPADTSTGGSPTAPARAEAEAENEEEEGPNVGVVLSGSARGDLTGGLIEGFTIGIEVREDATFDLDDLRIRTVEEAALVLRDRGTLSGQRVACADAPLGVAVLDDAVNELTGDGCSETRLP